MAMSERTKKGLLYGGGAAGLLLLLAGAAKVVDDDIVVEDDDDDGFDPTVVDPVTPNTPDPPPPPPPAANAKKNFVGSGYNWPRKDRFPNVQSFVTFLNTYGYGATMAQNIAMGSQNRAAVSKFQREWNKVRDEIAKSQPVSLGRIATDGLIGVGTINAMLQAEAWVNQRSTPWQGLVAMANAA